MADCKRCGAPLKKGNIKVVRPRGKKRPWRECRRCPDPKPVEAIQRPQDNQDGPVTVEAVFDYSEPPTFRFFMTQDQAARVRERLAKTILIPGFGVGFEVIPVPDYQVEADPDAFADLVEVNIEWKNE